MPTPSPTTTLEPNDCPTPRTDSHEATPRPAPAPMTAAVERPRRVGPAARARASPRSARRARRAATAPRARPMLEPAARRPQGLPATGTGGVENDEREHDRGEPARGGQAAGSERRPTHVGRPREETDDAEADDRRGEERHRVAHRRQGLERRVGPGAGVQGAEEGTDGDRDRDESRCTEKRHDQGREPGPAQRRGRDVPGLRLRGSMEAPTAPGAPPARPAPRRILHDRRVRPPATGRRPSRAARPGRHTAAGSTAWA